MLGSQMAWALVYLPYLGYKYLLLNANLSWIQIMDLGLKMEFYYKN